MKLALLILLASQAWGQCTGYSWVAILTVAPQSVSDGAFDYLISDTYDGTSGRPNLKDKLLNAPNDICFAANVDGSSPFTFYREAYSAGVLRAHIRGSLSTSSLNIYMFFGKSGGSDLSSASGTFPTSEYQARYSMSNSSDSTGNAYNLTAIGSPTGVAGKIGDAQQINSSNYFTWGATANLSTSITLSCWVKLDAGVTQTKLEMFQGSSQYSQWYLEFPFGDTNYSSVYSSYTYGRSHTAAGWPTSWKHYAIVRTGGSTATVKTYINGSEVDSHSGTTGDDHQLTNGDNAFKVPFLLGTGNVYVDECRVEETARSAGYITSRYANQNDPAGFITANAEASTSAATSRIRRIIVF